MNGTPCEISGGHFHATGLGRHDGSERGYMGKRADMILVQCSAGRWGVVTYSDDNAWLISQSFVKNPSRPHFAVLEVVQCLARGVSLTTHLPDTDLGGRRWDLLFFSFLLFFFLEKKKRKREETEYIKDLISINTITLSLTTLWTLGLSNPSFVTLLRGLVNRREGLLKNISSFSNKHLLIYLHYLPYSPYLSVNPFS